MKIDRSIVQKKIKKAPVNIIKTVKKQNTQYLVGVYYKPILKIN
jgi:hypothetical protein